MLSLGTAEARLCEGLSRREWLRAGGLSMLGFTLADWLRLRAAGGPTTRPGTSFGRAKSCIVVFLFGAPAHQDVWDLKPEAPADIRGEFMPIASSVPGNAAIKLRPAADGTALDAWRTRRGLLATLDTTGGLCPRLPATAAAGVRELDAFHTRALELVTAPAARRAFDLSGESPRLRD